MLYLHCGWMKTGTTSLRSALSGRREELAEAGIVLAQEWRVLTKELTGPQPDVAIGEFKRFLESHRDEDVLCSNEWLTSLAWKESSREAFLDLLTAAAEVMPVRCVWTLRRLDDLAVSVYLWLLLKGDPPLPLQRLAALPWVEETIIGMQRFEDAPLASTEYLEYDPEGRHNITLLAAMGLPAGLRAEIGEEMSAAPRHNTAVGHRQAAALLNAEALSARAGVAFDRGALQDAFDRGGFRFEGDSPCTLADVRTREVLHGRALRAAHQCGFDPYIRFFESSRIVAEQSPPDLSGAAVSDDDLARLVDHIRHSTPASRT